MKELNTIGFIEFNDIINERLVGKENISKLGICSVDIYDNEGNMPHCHIYNKNHKFETCVRLDKAEYFHHGGKYKDEFNSKQCKELNDWFSNTNGGDDSFTNWEICRLFWNISATNSNRKKIKISTQPDYTNIK